MTLPEAYHASGIALAGGRVAEPATAPLVLELVASRDLNRHHGAWAELCTRSLETNVFLEPGFALPLMQHVEPARRPDILLVWEDNGPVRSGRLVGLMPLTLPRRMPVWIARGYRDKQIALGLPLLDERRAADALRAILDWLGAPTRGIRAVSFFDVPTDGPFCALARCLGAERNLPLRLLDPRSRAILPRDLDPATAAMLGSAKHRKEARRQHRRLSQIGTRTYTSASTPQTIARATERFLALEHDGWKGEKQTSLLANPTLATFTRTMTRLMAHEGKCRIDAIEIDGRPVAMGIVLTVGGRAHFWKTAFDERLAACSPGVQFALDLTRRQLDDATVALTDSCAMPDHAMIERLWPARMAVADVLIGTSPGAERAFDRAVSVETLRRRLRAAAKDLIGRLRARRR